MAIANAVLKDRRVHVYDAKGHQLSTIPASTGDELVDPYRESRTLSYGIIKQPSACNSEMLGLG
jgi:hypothetical protein